ncbi:MAG: PEGA domain-containing protein [Isosphaeraceae bacterium]
MVWRRLPRRGALLALGLAALGLPSGCVERRYTIRTNPPGALVVVNGEEIGRTPVSKSFTYYGDRDVTLILDEHQTQRVTQPIKAPWYDNVVTEFFSENLIPFTIRDEREFTYQMAPTQIPSPADLMNRGQSLRDEAQAPPPARRGGLLGFFGF